MDYAAASIRFGRLARHLLSTRDDEDYKKCHPQPNIDLCEKPASSGSTTGIVIGSILAVIVLGTVVVLGFLHLRRKRLDEKEWPKNNQELEDYGFEVPSAATRRPQNTRRGKDEQQRTEVGITPPKPERGSLDNLERSLRGQTTGAFKRHDEEISADMKPVEPSDRI
ncbi:hypothetical protein F5Y19DRAFT_423714 [Xylariaceae sp. FL1651]|nr:hypothetical protein F5Y19DRAFT_423714 [Xylariaceae sp. FL1651]